MAAIINRKDDSRPIRFKTHLKGHGQETSFEHTKLVTGTFFRKSRLVYRQKDRALGVEDKKEEQYIDGNIGDELYLYWKTDRNRVIRRIDLWVIDCDSPSPQLHRHDHILIVLAETCIYTIFCTRAGANIDLQSTALFLEYHQVHSPSFQTVGGPFVSQIIEKSRISLVINKLRWNGDESHETSSYTVVTFASVRSIVAPFNGPSFRSGRMEVVEEICNRWLFGKSLNLRSECCQIWRGVSVRLSTFILSLFKTHRRLLVFILR